MKKGTRSVFRAVLSSDMIVSQNVNPKIFQKSMVLSMGTPNEVPLTLGNPKSGAPKETQNAIVL